MSSGHSPLSSLHTLHLHGTLISPLSLLWTLSFTLISRLFKSYEYLCTSLGFILLHLEFISNWKSLAFNEPVFKYASNMTYAFRAPKALKWSNEINHWIDLKLFHLHHFCNKKIAQMLTTFNNFFIKRKIRPSRSSSTKVAPKHELGRCDKISPYETLLISINGRALIQTSSFCIEAHFLSPFFAQPRIVGCKWANFGVSEFFWICVIDASARAITPGGVGILERVDPAERQGQFFPAAASKVHFQFHSTARCVDLGARAWKCLHFDWSGMNGFSSKRR